VKGTKALFCVLVLLAAVALAGDTANVSQTPAKQAPVRQRSAVAPAKQAPVVAPAQSNEDANHTRTAPPPERTQAADQATPVPQTPVSSEGYQDSRGGNPPNDHPRGGHGYPPRGRRDQWRYDHFRGSWNFLIYAGPIVYPRPRYFPSVVRIPRYRADVYVEYAGDDVTGADFVNALRDQLGREGLSLSTTASDAALELYVVSMDEDPTDPGSGSAVSVSYVWVPGYRFITAQLLDVGSQQADALAASAASYARQLFDEYR